MKILITGLIAVVLAVIIGQIWLFLPTLPPDLENSSLSRRCMESFVRSIFRTFIFAERLGVIDDSAKGTNVAFLRRQRPAFVSDTVSVEKTTLSNISVFIFRVKTKLLLHKPKALVYFHGGSFTLGSTDAYAPWISLLAENTNYTVISIEFRLAPENPFPAAIEDCLTATRAVFDEADRIGIDRNGIVVAGDSSGANFASIVAIELAASDKYRLAAQILISVVVVPPGILPLPSMVEYNNMYPIGADWFLAKYAGQPYTEAVESHIWSRKYISTEDTKRLAPFLNVSSLPDDIVLLMKGPTVVNSDDSGIDKRTATNLPTELVEIAKLALNERAWPLITTDNRLAKVATAFVTVCEYDMRRDEGLLYYARLRSLGIRVTLSFLPKAEHDEPVIKVITHSARTTAARKGFEDIVTFLKNQV